MQVTKLSETTSLNMKLKFIMQKRKTVILLFGMIVVFLIVICAIVKNLFPLIILLIFSFSAFLIVNFFKRRNDLFLDRELERFLDVFMSGLSAGFSVNKSIEFALNGFMLSRFRKIFVLINEQLALNIRPHIAIQKASEEFKIKEFELLAVILESQLRTGFPPNKLLFQVKNVITDKMKFERKIKLFNSQNDLSANILSSVPVMFLGSVLIFKTEYFYQLNQNIYARLFLLLAMLMDVMGFWVMKRLARYGS